MEKVRALGNAQTLMEFVLVASQTLADKIIYQDLVKVVTNKGRRFMDSLAAAEQGTFMHCLAKDAIATRLDSPPTSGGGRVCARGRP